MLLVAEEPPQKVEKKLGIEGPDVTAAAAVASGLLTGLAESLAGKVLEVVGLRDDVAASLGFTEGNTVPFALLA